MTESAAPLAGVRAPARRASGGVGWSTWLYIALSAVVFIGVWQVIAMNVPPVILPKRVDHLAPTPTPIPNLSKPTVTKSLLGEDNPFDRRH